VLPNPIVEFITFLLIMLALTPLLGAYIANVIMQKPTFMDPLVQPLERWIFRVSAINNLKEMTWNNYALMMFKFNLFGFCFLIALQLLQHVLPGNPQNFPAVPFYIAFNTAASFVTGTNWQEYAGETTMSYFTQMLGLTSQNFLSAATSMTAFMVLARSFTRKNMETIGNYWSDLVRTLLYLLLPAAMLVAILLLSQGVIQTFAPYADITTLEGQQQTIPLGPVASQVAIKQLGANGGGFFNANSAHPFENPSGLSNMIEMLALILIPAASIYAYGIIIGSRQHGVLLFMVMLALWMISVAISFYGEMSPPSVSQDYPYLEGKEVRISMPGNIIWNTLTSATGTGSINNQLGSLSPLESGVALYNIAIGEVFFGPIGLGVTGIIFYIILTLFLAGLMVGRTPEYLGKKIEKKEMQWTMLALLAPIILMLLGGGSTALYLQYLENDRLLSPHGLTEIVYAYASTAFNNGSSMKTLEGNYFVWILSFFMLLGRISLMLPCIAVAGLLARKRSVPISPGTFSTNTCLFAFLLMGSMIVFGGLSLFPVLSLGSLLEHMLMIKGYTF
jgi:K+-transporting ATPase ATPase A chain